MIEKRIDKNGVYLWARTNTIISLENMLSSMDYLINEITLPRRLRILEDATDTVVSFGIRDFETLAEKLTEVLEKYEVVRHAVIHNSPKNTAFTLHFKSYYLRKRYGLEVFSTLEAAISWLNADF
jgi:hypothetical protein